ncbi:DUF397 domain-containing protein [Spirillospora sp. NPDC052269]
MLRWRKSSFSGDDHGQCVEVAVLGASVGIRDSKEPDAGHLPLDLETFAAPVSHVKLVDIRGSGRG